MRTLVTTLFVLAAAAAATAADAIPSRFEKATAGEWAVMRDVSGEDAGTTKVRVDEVRGEGDGRVVVIVVERDENEPKRFELTMARHRERLAELEDKAKQVSRERLVVKGREMTVTAVSWDDEENSREFKIWLSDEIPVGGIVKTWSSDPEMPAVEVVDYGFN